METTENNTVTETKTPVTDAASASDNASTGATDTTSKDAAKQEPVAKTYDQSYIDKLLAEQEKARAEAVDEALKVAKMDEAGKATYEQEKTARELAEREEKIALRERKADTMDILDKNGVPREFLDMLVGKNMEETKTNVAAFKDKFDAAVQAQVEKRLAGSTPKGGSGSTSLSEEEAMASEIEKYL